MDIERRHASYLVLKNVCVLVNVMHCSALLYVLLKLERSLEQPRTTPSSGQLYVRHSGCSGSNSAHTAR